MMRYVDRDDVTIEMRRAAEAIAAIDATLQRKRRGSDTLDLMVEINDIISRHVEIDGSEQVSGEERRFNIAAIDFELLRREFARVRTRHLLLQDLEEVIQQRLDGMMRTNPSRINYYERYQAIIADYNAQQDRATIEKTFLELMDLVHEMEEEEKRYVREGFESDEELSLYDMLFRADLSKSDIAQLKAVAVSLLKKLKAKIGELHHFMDKAQTRAIVDNLIRDTLWNELPDCYDEDSVKACRAKVYAYVCTRYKDVA